MSRVAPYRVHRMIQDLVREPEAARVFAENPYPIFERYGVTAEEEALLEARSIESMTALGVHPNLQMKYMRLRKMPPTAGTKLAGPLDAYLGRLLEI